MTKLLMLADDYTGVLDTAVQFCKSGLSVAVTTRLNRAYIDARQSADVIALDTETRHLPPKDAYETVYRAARLAREAGIPYLYKKTDSTLRGNIGAEIAAAMDAYQSPYCAFLPAFIRQGRTTKGGIHYVNGILLGKAPIARDPFNPLYTSSVAKILRLQTVKPVISLPAPVPPAPPSGYGEGILVFDAQSDAHIQACAAFIAQSGIRVMAGCAGLAEYVGSILGAKGGKQAQSVRCTKALAICGSLNPVSLRQVRYAQMHGVPSVLTPGALREVSGYVNTPEGMALLNTLREKVKTSPALLMNLSPPEASQGQQEADETGRARIVQNAGELTAKLLDAERFDLLIVFGGDTLYGIIRALQNATVTPIAELAPGVAQSALTFGEGRRCTLISKSGGLGEEDFLPEMLSRFGVPTF